MLKTRRLLPTIGIWLVGHIGRLMVAENAPTAALVQDRGAGRIRAASWLLKTRRLLPQSISNGKIGLFTASWLLKTRRLLLFRHFRNIAFSLRLMVAENAPTAASLSRAAREQAKPPHGC